MQVDDDKHMGKKKEKIKHWRESWGITKVSGKAEEKQPTIWPKKKSSERWKNQRKVMFLTTKIREY